MKDPALLFVFLTASLTAWGQAQSDAIQQSGQMKLGSLRKNIVQLPDTLLPFYRKLDSIRTTFNLNVGSLRTEYQTALSKIDGATNKVNNRIDSLGKLNKPAYAVRAALDSLNRLRYQTQEKFSARLNELKAKTTGGLNALNFPLEYKDPLETLTKNVNGLNLATGDMKIPELKIPGYTLPEIDGIGALPSKTGEIGSLNNLGNLTDADTPVGDLGQVTQQAKAYQEDIRNIAEGNLNDVQALPETIEAQASKIEGIDELQKQSAIVDEHKAQLDEFAEPDNAKEKVTEVARKAAVNHFAGKEEQLKSAMEKISKYKQKYSSVSSIKDLPKRPPNPMKSKPFIERLVPGLYFQYQQKNFYLVDVNPYLGYRLTGRIAAGLGWNHRYAYDKNTRGFNSQSRIFGPRGYVDFKLGKGFIAHLEGESMNSFVPSTLRGNPDSGQREWVWSFMTGLKKEYKIYRNLKGTALIQYNWFNRYYKAPYVDRLNSRIGFEYILKSKAKRK